ncbi:MAG: intradiol ring-cleavage dioxygenase [bacterium]|nr:MAG: intradiol ring-cleavage dioxygenase [bacterium]
MTLRHALAATVLFAGLFQAVSPAAGDRCPPTRPDAEGPFYRPSAPVRESTGSGLVIEGTVRTAGSCAPVAGARVEWWQAGPSGQYDDDHRGARVTGSDGRFRIETDVPPPYQGRPPHVHFKVFAAGHRTLTTQVYPEAGRTTVPIDFVLTAD